MAKMEEVGKHCPPHHILNHWDFFLYPVNFISQERKHIRDSEPCCLTSTRDMRRLMDDVIDLVSDAEENSTSYETSSEETEDVKVCDICGDIGEEKKLAVCSRCNDGAEHTYCMRVMIQEVPESGWVCEECQTEVEIGKEKKKLKISRVKVGQISSENKVDIENVGHKDSSKENQGNNLAIKRKEEDGGIIDTSEPRSRNVCCVLCSSSAHCDCPSFAMETEVWTSGCTSSVKEEDGGPCIGVSGTVNENKSCHGREQICISEAKDISNVISRNKRSNTRIEAKCSDDIEHVKVCGICGDVGEEEKLVICDRCNEGAEHIYCMQVMMEEVPKVKWLCEACQTGIGNEKERKKLEKTQLMVQASKGQSSEGKMNKPVNDSNSRSSSDIEMEAENVGSKESNIGNQSNGMATKRKEEGTWITSPIRVPLSFERPLKLDAKKGKEAAKQTPTSLASNDVKNQAPSLRGRLSKSISFNNSKIPKVKQLVIEVPLKTKNLKEPLSCMKKQESSTLGKSTSFKKPNSTEPANKGKSSILPHAEEPRVMNSLISHDVTNTRSTSVIGHRSFNASMAAPVPSKSKSTTQHLNKRNDMDSVGIAYGQGGRDSVGHSELKKPLIAKGHGRRFLDRSSTMLSDLTDKTQIFSPSDERIASTFPELAYIWQGCFELRRTGRSPELCKGLQAHLSCSASPKVLEMAKKFPSKIQLEELSRQNLCPPRFNENDHMYDSIGLFFFATDTDSYENHYSQLVGNMLKDDLALRGNIERAELLIFPSNILSKNFQRWNMFYYLWGVFRVRREDQNLSPQVPTSKCSNFSEDLLVVDLRNPVLSPGCSFLKDQNDSAKSDPTLLKSATQEDSQCFLPLERNHECSSSENSSSQLVCGGPLEDHPEDSLTASFFNSRINDVVIAPTRKNQKLADKMWDSSNEPGKESTPISRDNGEHLMDVDMDVDHVSTTEVSPRNEDHTSRRSGGAHTRNADIVNWADEVMVSHKKIKLDN